MIKKTMITFLDEDKTSIAKKEFRKVIKMYCSFRIWLKKDYILNLEFKDASYVKQLAYSDLEKRDSDYNMIYKMFNHITSN